MTGRHTDRYSSNPWKTQNYYRGGGGEEEVGYGGDGRRKATVTFAPAGNYVTLKETVVEKTQTQTHSYITDYSLPEMGVSDLGKIENLPFYGPPSLVEPARYYASNNTNGKLLGPPSYYYCYTPAPPLHHSYSPLPAPSAPAPRVEVIQHVKTHPMAASAPRPTKYWQRLGGPCSSDSDQRRSPDAVGYVVGDGNYDDAYNEKPARAVERQWLPAAAVDFQPTRSTLHAAASLSRGTKFEDAVKPMRGDLANTGTGAYGLVENRPNNKGLRVAVPKHAGLAKSNTGKGAYGGFVDNNAAETIDSREAAKQYGGLLSTREYCHHPDNYSKRDLPPHTITSWDAAILCDGVLVEEVAFSP